MIVIDVFLKVFSQDNNFSGILIYFAIYIHYIEKNLHTEDLCARIPFQGLSSRTKIWFVIKGLAGLMGFRFTMSIDILYVSWYVVSM